nr:hypothetical protein Iba_chr14fCG10910 [Ipomoea batatas]GME06166.1 hypothetical protein Iba_scaffold3961.4CG0690 [Ipomoea batatas]
MLHTGKIWLKTISQIPSHEPKLLFVNSHEQVYCTLSTSQGGHMWQKIIPNKETHEYKIINNALEINLKRRIWNSEFILQVLPQGPNIEELQMLFCHHFSITFFIKLPSLSLRLPLTICC